MTYLTVHTPDTARLRDFYGSVLDWTLHAGRIEDGWEVDACRPQVGIAGGADRSVAVPMWVTDDVEVAVGRVRAAGGTVLDEPRTAPYGVSAVRRRPGRGVLPGAAVLRSRRPQVTSNPTTSTATRGHDGEHHQPITQDVHEATVHRPPAVRGRMRHGSLLAMSSRSRARALSARLPFGIGTVVLICCAAMLATAGVVLFGGDPRVDDTDYDTASCATTSGNRNRPGRSSATGICPTTATASPSRSPTPPGTSG